MTKQLITISDNAAKRIKEILSNAESGVKGVRVSVKSGGCAGMEYEMTYLKETIPTDEVVKDNNVEVFIDPKAIMYLLGTKMDYKEASKGKNYGADDAGKEKYLAYLKSRQFEKLQKDSKYDSVIKNWGH